MANISDELTGKFFDSAPDKTARALKTARQTVKETKNAGVNAAKAAASGIVMIFKGGKFTTEAVMSQIGNMMANHNGKVEYGKNSVAMEDLYNSGQVTRLDDSISKDVMKYFNKHCNKAGIKYSVMKDAGTDNYYVFFKSKELDAITTIVQESYKDYLKESSRRGKQQEQGREEGDDKKKESVREKLKSFQEYVKEHSSEEPEKSRNRSDRSR